MIPKSLENTHTHTHTHKLSSSSSSSSSHTHTHMYIVAFHRIRKGNKFEGFDTNRVYAIFAKTRQLDALVLDPMVLGTYMRSNLLINVLVSQNLVIFIADVQEWSRPRLVLESMSTSPPPHASIYCLMRSLRCCIAMTER